MTTTTAPTRVRYTGDQAYNAATGTINLGPRLDTGGPAPWLLHSATGMHGGVILGDPGMGASRLLDVIALGAMASTTTAVWYIDAQGGTSSPALADAAARTATTPGQARDMIADLAALVDSRFTASYDPIRVTADRPGVLVLIDGLADVLRDSHVTGMLEPVAHAWAGAGVALAGTAHDLSLFSFGGSQPIRAAMTSNIVDLYRGPAMGSGPLPQQREALGPIPGRATITAPRTGGRPGTTGPLRTFQAFYAGTGRDAEPWFRQFAAAQPAVDERTC